MLNSSSNPQKSTKLNEYVMRRRARNLRAKVKALLPVQTCCRHDNRNRCVNEIECNKKSWKKLSSKNNWTMCQQKQNNYYFQNSTVINHNQRFQKLSALEIQQIKQDKLYYLGQENLKDFQQFLKGKQKNCLNLTDESHQLLMRTFENFSNPKSPYFFTKFRRNTELLSNFQQTFAYNNNSHLKRIVGNSYDEKFENFMQRRKQILFEQKSNKLMQKVKLNMRLERAQIKLKQINQKRLSQLKLRSDLRNQKLSVITNRRKNLKKQGQIKQLQQKLRRTFLTKVNKVDNFDNKTVRQYPDPYQNL